MFLANLNLREIDLHVLLRNLTRNSGNQAKSIQPPLGGTRGTHSSLVYVWVRHTLHPIFFPNVCRCSHFLGQCPFQLVGVCKSHFGTTCAETALFPKTLRQKIMHVMSTPFPDQFAQPTCSDKLQKKNLIRKTRKVYSWMNCLARASACLRWNWMNRE